MAAWLVTPGCGINRMLSALRGGSHRPHRLCHPMAWWSFLALVYLAFSLPLLHVWFVPHTNTLTSEAIPDRGEVVTPVERPESQNSVSGELHRGPPRNQNISASSSYRSRHAVSGHGRRCTQQCLTPQSAMRHRYSITNMAPSLALVWQAFHFSNSPATSVSADHRAPT